MKKKSIINPAQESFDIERAAIKQEAIDRAKATLGKEAPLSVFNSFLDLMDAVNAGVKITYPNDRVQIVLDCAGSRIRAMKPSDNTNGIGMLEAIWICCKP